MNRWTNKWTDTEAWFSAFAIKPEHFVYVIMYNVYSNICNTHQSINFPDPFFFCSSSPVISFFHFFYSCFPFSLSVICWHECVFLRFGYRPDLSCALCLLICRFSLHVCVHIYKQITTTLLSHVAAFGPFFPFFCFITKKKTI